MRQSYQAAIARVKAQYARQIHILEQQLINQQLSNRQAEAGDPDAMNAMSDHINCATISSRGWQGAHAAMADLVCLQPLQPPIFRFWCSKQTPASVCAAPWVLWFQT